MGKMKASGLRCRVDLGKDMVSVLRSALNSARGRSRKKGEPFDLTFEYLMDLWVKQKGRCALSGLPFNGELFCTTFVKRPFAPSIDRIENAKSYTQDNVQLVCTAVNFARGQWGDDVLRQIAYGIVETERKDEKQWYVAKKAMLKEETLLLATLDGQEAKRQKHRIAGLKATITKGPSRLRSAARRAVKK